MGLQQYSFEHHPKFPKTQQLVPSLEGGIKLLLSKFGDQPAQNVKLKNRAKHGLPHCLPLTVLNVAACDNALCKILRATRKWHKALPADLCRLELATLRQRARLAA